MRDRLIELLDELGVIVNVPDKVDEDGCGTYTIEGGEYVADYLLANGVILPPVKVGQTVYVIATKHPCYACKWCSDFCHKDCHFDDKTKLVVKKAIVNAVYYLERTNEIHIEIEQAKNLYCYTSTYYFNDFGKTVFLAKEEAEKALERSNQ